MILRTCQYKTYKVIKSNATVYTDKAYNLHIKIFMYVGKKGINKKEDIWNCSILH